MTLLFPFSFSATVPVLLHFPMLSRLHSMTMLGMESLPVEVEVDIRNGMVAFTIVGLADMAVQEAKERVKSAIKNSGFRFPGPRITINLAPADVRKVGPLFDLPLAIGILLASDQIPFSDIFENSIFLGELALDGRLRPVSGVLPVAMSAKEKGVQYLFVPAENANEAGLVEGITVYGVEKLSDLIAHFLGEKLISPTALQNIEGYEKHTVLKNEDFSAIKGQEQAKRALEIAAAGAHNVLMCGSPGSGKTLMARAFRGILPHMTREESFEVSKIYSLAGLLPARTPLITKRPFRTIHHTASSISIVGGGKSPKPGEISLAHRGVLFLDEIAEFPSSVLEVLRQPLEDRKITVSRVSGSSEFPAHFSLIGAMNPCPCGYYNVPNSDKTCTCALSQISKYQKRLSGPLLDRIDLYIEISPVKFEKLSSKEDAEPSERIAERVQKARNIQKERFTAGNVPLHSNAEMKVDDVKRFCPIEKDAEDILKNAMRQFSLSARAYHRILKISRTIADLAGTQNITIAHVAEALQYRPKIAEE